MGVDCKLFINAKYGVGDVTKMLQSMEGVSKFRAEYREDHAFLLFDYNGEDRQMMVYKTSNHGPDCTGLSLGQWGSATLIMKAIASKIGGFLNESDCYDSCEMIQDPHEGNAAFVLKHQILSSRMPTDARELSDSVAKATGYER